MEGARPLKNGEEGKFIPVRELLEKQAKEARQIAGDFLVHLYETTGDLTVRPIVVELADGNSVVQEFRIDPSVFDS
jgi:hypothetical protein